MNSISKYSWLAKVPADAASILSRLFISRPDVRYRKSDRFQLIVATDNLNEHEAGRVTDVIFNLGQIIHGRSLKDDPSICVISVAIDNIPVWISSLDAAKLLRIFPYPEIFTDPIGLWQGTQLGVIPPWTSFVVDQEIAANPRLGDLVCAR